MLSSNVYCPLCGVILLPNTYVDDTRVRPWYAQVRGIYPTNAAAGDPVTTTGVGFVRYRKKLHAPLDSDRSYFDVGIGPLEEWKLCESSGRWCFGIHDSCWRLLLLRLCHFQDKAAIAKSVFYQLYCTPCLYASTFQFGHDYEGAAQTHEPFGRPAVNRMSQFYADPFEIPHNLEDFGRFQPYVPSSSDTTEDRREKLERDIFTELSPELKFEILSYLPFDEILNMRLVCRDLALLAAVESLPLSYWRSRFLLGQEFDFLFPSLTDTQNWFRVFFGTRAFLRAGYTELVNRKRIRQLLEPIAALVELEATLCKGPYGSAFHQRQSQGGYFQLIDDDRTEKAPQFIEIASSFSGQLTSITEKSLLEEGCRVLYHRAQSFMPPRQEHRQRIGISTVQIGAKSFISGINLFPSGEHNVVDRLVGYHIPASEVWIDIPSTVKSLCVAFCSEGLTGIKLTFTNSDSSSWVGINSGLGIVYGTIDIPDMLEQYCLLAGLDRYKIVSLSLGKLTLTSHPGASLKLPSQDAMDSLRVQSYLWTSHVPVHEGLRISPLLPSVPSRAFEPLTNIDFGGPRGLFLKSLTRLTFYMASDAYPITGIEIFYSDRRSLLFGSKDGCELCFFLDGSNGERINQFGALEDNQRDSIGLGGLQISTNYGRTTTFAPLRLRLNAAISRIPISPSGNTITGLVALEQTNQTRFIRVGVQSQQCDEQPKPPPPDILDHECHRTPEYQLRYDDKFTHFINSSNPGNYQTYASLKNIRKIQASMGIQGRSRISNRLSGLKFEYYNHPSPSTVGQWMDEIDDGFEFSLDEAVQSLTIWLTPMGYSTERGLEVGQVAAIHIETTHSRSVTFRSPDFRSLPPQKLQHQYQSYRDETLTGISWILNASCDRVRAVISASTNEGGRPQILVPEHSPPFDQVRKLYFATQNDDGYRDTIVTAEAYFRDRAIIGLVFVYTSAAKASLGDFDTNARQTVRFPRDARIIGFSVATKKRDLVEIEFEVERSEQPLYKKLRLSINYTVGYDRRDVWCKDGASAESHQRLLAGDRVYEPPSESKLVGIYVGCQEFFRVGALYEPEVPQ